MTLTREQGLFLGFAAVAVLIGVICSPWSPLTQKAAVGAGWEGTTWSPQQPRVGHYARGGLYHPAVCGEGRTELLKHGWAWIADPPSEQTGPGVDSA